MCDDACRSLIDQLIAIRKQRGMTQRDLAAAAKLAQPAIARLVRRAAAPLLHTVFKVLDALDKMLAVVPK